MQHRLKAILRKPHVARQIRERHLRLDHPEFCEVPRRVGVFSPKRGPEGVYLPQCHRTQLSFQLSAYGKIGGLSEKVLSEVHFIRIRFWNVVQIQCGHLEHLACSFSIASRDDRGVHLEKPTVREELVNGKIQRMANTKDGSEGACSKPQVCLFTQKLHGVPFHLNRKRFRIGIAQNFQFRDLQFSRLT